MEAWEKTNFCLLAALQKPSCELVNFDKLREVTQRPDENPAKILTWITELSFTL